MKTSFVWLMTITIILAGCGGGEGATSNEEKISGKESKTWKAIRETNAAGEKDKLTRAEKKESITFNRSGNVKMTNSEEIVGGTWSLQNNTLSLQFTGTNVTENFTVLELTDEKIRLLAADGSQLTLEAE